MDNIQLIGTILFIIIVFGICMYIYFEFKNKFKREDINKQRKEIKELATKEAEIEEIKKDLRSQRKEYFSKRDHYRKLLDKYKSKYNDGGSAN